jgi:HIV Tat-specific factor 1
VPSHSPEKKIRLKNVDVWQKMNERYFSGRKIEAYLFDGKERFKKSGPSQVHEDGEEAGETERLADFEEWLMAEGEGN